MQSINYDEKCTVCIIIIIFIVDPKARLRCSNKIDSLRNSGTFFNLPNMFRRYICLLSTTKSEITVEFKEHAMLQSSNFSDLLSFAMLLK